ncbi:MAG: hypothetical protein NDI82_02680, partial [Anaeromyxobacteraceae bacterium]|nr:hypothetical protein [Anaeromyxobacteraceae bacterium]
MGRFLSDEHRFVRVAFADALKEGAMVLMGLSRDQLWGDRRNERDERWGQTPRELYQRLGDALRSIHPDALILAPLDKCRGLLGEGRSVVVTDVRMQREADRIRELGGVLWRVRRHRVP